MTSSTPTPRGLILRTGDRARRGRLAVALLAAVAIVALLLGGTAVPAHAATKAWGGYTDGKIPLSALRKIPNAWLRPDAATGYSNFSAAFSAKFDKPLSVIEGYRTYNRQKDLFTARYTPYATAQKNDVEWAGKYWVQKPKTSVAAVPGTSVHGWAMAVDFSANVNKAGTAEKKWADANGPKYGWYPVGNSFGEPWHFEFTPLPAKK